jgi:Zn-dependent metalloprotease
MLRSRSVLGVFLAFLLSAAVAAQAPPSSEFDRQVELLAAAAGGSASVSVHRATGVASFVRLARGSLVLDGTTPIQKSVDFFVRHGEVFGISDPFGELSVDGGWTDRYGRAHTTHRQVHQGIPVFAGVLRTHFDPAGNLTAVNGTFVPGISVDPRPVLTPPQALEVALARVRELPGTPADARLRADGGQLLVFRSGLVRRVPGRDHLVYEVEVGNEADVREFVYVDAHSGKVVDRITGIHEAIDRVIHEPLFNESVIWEEGDSLPYSTGDPGNDDQVNGLIDQSAAVRDLFSNLSGGTFLSWDGTEGTMHSIWKAGFLGCPNASWNGTSTNFCDGVASDDVVVHEWAHAYTSTTHGLIYQWQPGALNESYSDIFGELVDLINGAGTDSPAATRSAGGCSVYKGNVPPNLNVHSPLAVAGSYEAAGAIFDPPPPIAVTADVELVNDGDDEGGSGSATDACQALSGFTSGRIALLDRGNCTFKSKVVRAQNAGAVGVILVNTADTIFRMSGSDPSIVIPTVMIAQSDGQVLKDQLANGVNATLATTAATADTYRWLMGEDSFGFGGAIRDLWNPPCLGDPAKVDSAWYHCSTSDGGGVHTNSGVPNHAFALLVDGGTFNGQSIAAIGTTKAAHVYWRAMSVYQVPDTDFADHADALQQACTDLVGIDLPDLLDGEPSGEVIDGTDCAQVAKASLAVELAAEPPCSFQPLLDPDAPSFECGTVAFDDDFETDPAAGWTFENEGVHEEYDPRDWAWTADLPPGGEGSALFGIDSLEIGNCVPGDDDQSGVMTATSPSIPVAAPLRLAFDHYVATEALWDGGNLKISVNKGPFELVGPERFTFNAYNATLNGPEQNTNPLAGERAFTGGDGGQVAGSWGQSQVDLTTLAAPGDTIRLRFDLGVDGCNGLKGWYVDNLLVCTGVTAAGAVPDGHTVGGTPLLVGKSGPDSILLAWEESCVGSDGDYAVYEGALGDFTSHLPKQCSTGGDTSSVIEPSAASAYYLVVPRNTGREGSYGTDSEGVERNQGAAACLAQSVTGCD